MHVTAVVVAHDGGNYLPRTLAALSNQTRSADAAIGVDAGSTDHSAELLRNVLGDANVVELHHHAKAGFGSAVRSGLEQLAPAGSASSETTEWIWLLHDDAAPAPDALAELLHAVERTTSVTVAGCKQLGWDDERHLVDVACPRADGQNA